MGQVPLYSPTPPHQQSGSGSFRALCGLVGRRFLTSEVHGYLAHKKLPPPRTLQ